VGRVLTFRYEVDGDLISLLIQVETPYQTGVHKANVALDRFSMNVEMLRP
jgi:hypothetical protein